VASRPFGAAYRTGDPHANLVFRDLIDRRADRLLDELLRHREAASDRVDPPIVM
jgi:hypothetical protein